VVKDEMKEIVPLKDRMVLNLMHLLMLNEQ
jgi:hypothetical protein